MSSQPFIQVPTFESLRDFYLSRMKTFYAQHGIDFLGDESDPAYYWAEDTAQQRLVDILSFNAGADANSILTATGEALDRLAANHGLQRDGRTDEQLRALIYDSWAGLVSGTDQYALRLALLAEMQLGDELSVGARDAAVEFRRPNNRYDVYFADQDGETLPAADLNLLGVYMNVPGRVESWLLYNPLPAVRVDYTVSGTVKYRHRRASPETTVKLSLIHI